MKYKKFGFTLIELLIVMTIIGFLAVMTLTLMPKYVKRAQEVKNIEMIRKISEVIKTSRTTKTISHFDLDFSHRFENEEGVAVKFHDLFLRMGGFRIPQNDDPLSEFIYIYEGKEKFLILTCSIVDRKNRIIMSGTETFLKELKSNINIQTICPENTPMSRNIVDYGDFVSGVIISNGLLIDLN